MRKELTKIKGEFLDKIATLITDAFGLVMALAWNGLIRTIFRRIFEEQTTIASMTWYAVIVTIVGVLLTVWVGRAVARAKGG